MHSASRIRCEDFLRIWRDELRISGAEQRIQATISAIPIMMTTASNFRYCGRRRCKSSRVCGIDADFATAPTCTRVTPARCMRRRFQATLEPHGPALLLVEEVTLRRAAARDQDPVESVTEEEGRCHAPITVHTE